MSLLIDFLYKGHVSSDGVSITWLIHLYWLASMVDIPKLADKLMDGFESSDHGKFRGLYCKYIVRIFKHTQENGPNKLWDYTLHKIAGQFLRGDVTKPFTRKLKKFLETSPKAKDDLLCLILDRRQVIYQHEASYRQSTEPAGYDGCYFHIHSQSARYDNNPGGEEVSAVNEAEHMDIDVQNDKDTGKSARRSQRI